MTDDRTPLGIALHERVRDEHPDLDELVRVSTSRGTRIRRRRRAGAAVAVVAGVAAVAVAVGSQLGGSGGTTGTDPGFARQPTKAPAAVPTTAPRHHRTPGTDAPVLVDAPRWRCDEPADEKFICSHGTASVVVNWRPAASRPDYLDPGKADVIDGVHTYVSRVHGRFFATVAPAPGTTQAQVDEVGSALAWTR